MTRIRHRHHANPFTVRGEIEPLELDAVFGRSAPVALDVGFGRGAFLLELARRHAEWNVVGIELRPFLVDDVTQAARAEGLHNLYAMVANANEHLSTLLPDGCVAFAAINFPDPWFKKRHHKRRVVNREWLELLSRKLVPGAQVHAMTDYAQMAHVLLKAFEALPCFVNLAGAGKFAPESTTGIMTEREVKHQGRGEPIFRLHYGYRPAQAPPAS